MPEETCEGDFNEDGDVDGADLAVPADDHGLLGLGLGKNNLAFLHPDFTI